MSVTSRMKTVTLRVGCGLHVLVQDELAGSDQMLEGQLTDSLELFYCAPTYK